MKIFVLIAILACAAAAPLYVADEVHIPIPSKTTITKSNLAINHGGHLVASVPIVHSVPLIHSVPVHPVHILHAEPKKTTVTKSHLSINHGSTHVVHAVHTAPVHILHAEPKKTTVTKSHLSINHGDTHVVHNIPVHSTSVLVHAAPVKSVVHHVQPVHLVHSAPVVGRIGDAALTHQSSTVLKTEPVSLIAVHH